MTDTSPSQALEARQRRERRLQHLQDSILRYEVAATNAATLGLIFIGLACIMAKAEVWIPSVLLFTIASGLFWTWRRSAKEGNKLKKEQESLEAGGDKEDVF